MNKKIRQFISKGLMASILFSNVPISSLAINSTDNGRYEVLEGQNISISNILEEQDVNVEIYGNTLTNYSHIKTFTAGDVPSSNMNPLLIPGNTYTFSGNISNVVNGPFQGAILRIVFTDGDFITPLDTMYKNGNFKVVFTMPSNKEIKYYNMGWIRNYVAGQSAQLDDLMILDGDWSNKEVPEYFEGIKSVGENKENNTHKIEVLSIGKNLYDKTQVRENPENPPYVKPITPIKVKPNTTYTKSNTTCVELHDSIGNITVINRKVSTFTTNADTVKVSFNIEKELIDTFQFVEGDSISEYTPYNINKKEIILNEPLRGLPNGIKDRVVKKDGKWYIERNVGQADLVMYGGNQWIGDPGMNVADDMIGFYNILSTANMNYNGTGFEKKGNIVCDKLHSCVRGNLQTETRNSIVRGNYYVGVVVRRSDLETEDLEGVKKYINSLGAKFIYNLATPVYEPLSINPLINLYKDTSYVSIDDDKGTLIKVTVDRVANRAKEYAELAKTNATIENLTQARYWINLMKESILKDEFQSEVNNIYNISDLTLEKKNLSVNCDIYIQMKNTLSLSLNTNNIIFEDFDNTEYMEKQEAVQLSVTSSLPYKVNAYLETPIYSLDKSKALEMSVLNIKPSVSSNYQGFTDIKTPLLLLDDQNAGVNTIHKVDLRLAANKTCKTDIYKTAIKFEIEQK